MNTLIKILAKSGLLKGDLDLHLVRAAMVLIFVLFGYQKWFEYEAETLNPFTSNGPLIFWLYPVFGVRGASWFLGASEWLFAALLFWGFWEQESGGSWRSWLPFCNDRDRHHHSIHAGRLGRGCRFPGDERQCGFPDEGCGSSCCLVLFAEAGRRTRIRCRGRTERTAADG